MSNQAPPSSGYNVVLLHAFPLSSAMWDRMIEAVREERHDVEFLPIDLPGFGDAPLRSEWTMEEAAEIVHTTLRDRNITKCVVAGLSMGGYVALAFVRKYPEMVAGLVLANTSAFADSAEQKAARNDFIAETQKRGAAAALDRLLPNFITASTPPDLQSQIRDWILSADPKAIVAALAAMRDRPDSTELLPGILVPTLIISSSEDKLGNPESRPAMVAALQDPTYVVMEGAAHLTVVERPKEWAQVLSGFLDRLR